MPTYTKIAKERMAKGLCPCGNEREDLNRITCRTCRSVGMERAKRAKQMILNHYGAVCVCCGETTPEFLCIDHKNKDGARRRRQDKREFNLAHWVIKNSFPKDMQILCFNCNMARRFDNHCPHEDNRLIEAFK